MDKENRDKPKKKKPPRKDPDDGPPTRAEGTTSDAPHPFHRPEERNNLTKVFRPRRPQERATNAPDAFYIAHPRNIKRTAHFKDVHSRKLAELLEAFHMFDFDRDGEINEDDLRKTFASLCMPTEDEEIKRMVSEALTPLNFDAFVILLGCRTLDLDPEEVLLDALSNWDDHDLGLVPYERLVQHITAWGDRFTEEEAVSALADAPVVLNKAKEKMIDYVQFSEDLCGLRKMMQKRTDEESVDLHQ